MSLVNALYFSGRLSVSQATPPTTRSSEERVLRRRAAAMIASPPTRRSLPGQLGAQVLLQHLAHLVLRQGIDEVEGLRLLEARQSLTTEVGQLRCIDLRAGGWV